MLKVDKGSIPQPLQDIHKDKGIRIWEDLSKTKISLKRRHDLRNEMLVKEQSGYCVYCERNIVDLEKESSIEHIKPRSKFPSLIFDYDNMVVSCQSRTSCTQIKDDQWDALFIHPVLDDPCLYFDYDMESGEVIPKRGLDSYSQSRAVKTIEILNLNEWKLKGARKTLVLQMRHIQKNEDKEFENFQKFPSLIQTYRDSL